MRDIEDCLDGNLCRCGSPRGCRRFQGACTHQMTLARSCTGYRPILDAAKSFAGDKDAWCEQVEQVLASSPDLAAGVQSEESPEGDAATFRVVDDALLQPRRVMQQVRTTSAGRVRQHAAYDDNVGTSRRCHGHGGGGASALGCSGGGACGGCSKHRTEDVQDGAAGSALSAALANVRACDACPRSISRPRCQPKFSLQSLRIEGKRAVWFRPTTLPEFIEIMRANPGARIVVGGSEVRGARPPTFWCVTLVLLRCRSLSRPGCGK